MRRFTIASRPGVALLLVLAALVVTVTALATFARLAATSAVASSTDQRAQLADDLARAAEAAIVDWLASESGAVVLPPDAPTPMVAVLDDEWETSDTRVRVRITGWDQEGMAPLAAMKGASPIRLGLPEYMRQAIDDINPEGVPGLDALEAPFPRPEDEQPALGATIATHNPLPDELTISRRTRRATPSPARLNVSTAPVELIEAAVRAEHRGGLEHVIQSRARGEQPNMSDAPRMGSEAELLLVNSSQTWSFRVDVTIGNVDRSWWTVWTRSGTGRDGWKVVQRLVVDE